MLFLTCQCLRFDFKARQLVVAILIQEVLQKTAARNYRKRKHTKHNEIYSDILKTKGMYDIKRK